MFCDGNLHSHFAPSFPVVSSDIMDFYGSLLPFPSALGCAVCVGTGQCVSGWHHWFVKHAVYPSYSFNLLHVVF